MYVCDFTIQLPNGYAEMLTGHPLDMAIDAQDKAVRRVRAGVSWGLSFTVSNIRYDP